MKIATILMSGLLCLSSGASFAQSAETTAGEKPIHAVHAKAQRGPDAARDPVSSDRAIDAEIKRIDRMMTICNGC
ncbi:hypothetical protein P7D22_02980 [Lichenihabitans sp. Uapishka_5]|uniref:hypothetical protein n=1 Tax=Lichenihabitans sp. Uapishka_5 TaxID=3037302 RepID=UPI0029E7DE17|nr:hypothetical protein [Lichenihabitans sp. Uapishka_5]MDX7950140.1 hypothetical protein [Lichenihabitans sp. Uapishka_5]